MPLMKTGVDECMYWETKTVKVCTIQAYYPMSRHSDDKSEVL